MKTIRFTIFSILFGLLVLASACKKESTPVAVTQSGSKILVTGQDAGIGLKTALIDLKTKWIISSDKVGIYSDLGRTATSSGGSVIANAMFTAAASEYSSAFTGDMFWGTGTAIDHKFYAYYPYKAGAAASTAVPVTLIAAQTQSAAGNSDHIGALDFMVATPVTVTSPANTNAVGGVVNLSYNHLFTIIEFQITGSGTLNAVKLSSTSNTVAFSGGTIDLNQTPTAAPYTFATQTGTTTQAVVNLTNPATITGTVQKVYMVINPSTALENCYIGLLSGTTWSYITKASPDGGFLRGKKYVVAVSTTDAGAAPSGAPIDPAIDPDGNTYGTVTIGTQTWMTTNLKTTKYNDGTSIPNVTVDATWKGLTTAAYCWYNNDAGSGFGATYGALYNWYAVDNNASTKVASNGGKNICPTGWHVPSDTEWTTLTTYLGGTTVAGGKLKETGTTHWKSTNYGADNSSGFTALPGGFRYYVNGSFVSVGDEGYWWSSMANDATNAWHRELYYNDAGVYTYSGNNYKSGISVRCVRD
jgi:uncharacterized protein (TIGR02145 family)